jgi:SSS family solute:Na+ symporter
MMETLDWGILGIYFVALIGLGFYWGRKQESEKDYFLGGRRIPSWAIGISIMATQCGSISLIGAPAFVALASGGGMRWLQYEFAVPLAMILIALILVPTFYRSKITTAYEYLEKRFNPATRSLISLMFLLSRGLATGCAVYAPAVVLSAATGLDLTLTILLIGGIAIVYTIIGGIKAVIYSDVIQLVILWGSIFASIAIVVQVMGGTSNILSAIPVERAQAIDFSHTGFDGYTYAFWPMVIGGVFHYFSYYGCDQSQMQRVLSSRSEDRSKNSLFLNGLLRFPLVLTYCLFGLLLIGFLANQPSFAADVAAQENIDFLVPMFMLRYMPVGLTGLVMAGIFAAAMSSLDSAYNSLSAATVHDFYRRYVNKNPTEKQCLFWGRIATLGWGLFCVGFAFVVGKIAETIIVGINMIGSAFYGPILAAFLLALLSKRTRGYGVIGGVLAGVSFNLWLWIYQPQVSWMWWNLTGCIVTLLVGYGTSLFLAKPKAEKIKPYVIEKIRDVPWRSKYLILLLYFVCMIIISYSLVFVL